MRLTNVGVFRFLFYPIVRAGEQARASKQGITAAVGAFRKSSGTVASIGAVADPNAEFQRLYDANGWSEPELALQLKAVRRTKFFAMATSLVSFLAVLYFLVGIPAWVALLVVPMALFAIALGIAMTVKYTLFQEQLRRRTLLTFRDLMSEADFFKNVLT